MDHSPGQRRWRTLPILLGVLLIAALLTAIFMAPMQARSRMHATTQALTSWLWPTRWIWPLAAALSITALSLAPARRRWPTPVRRIPLAIGVFVGLIGLASLATVSQPGAGLLILGVVVAVGLLVVWAFVIPHRIVPRVPKAVLDQLPSDRDRLEVTEANAKSRNEVRATALQALGGLAVLAGAVLAFQQLTDDRQQANATQELARQGQASQRFTIAIDQLGSDRREVQLGGIYGLEQVAQQAPDNRLAVTEVLIAYLHRSAPRAGKSTSTPTEEMRTRAPDTQAILTVLGRRQVEPSDPRLDLRDLDLRRADLRGANLTRADLRGTDLNGSELSAADLSAVIGEGVLLENARLSNVNLAQGNFRFADIRNGHVRGGKFLPSQFLRRRSPLSRTPQCSQSQQSKLHAGALQ